MHKAIAVVMDPIEGIHTEKDTSFALMLEAQRRGYRVLYVQPGSLAIRDGKAIATMAEVQLKDDKYQYFTKGDWQTSALSTVQVVLMRKDPPVTDQFIHDTRSSAWPKPRGCWW